MHNQFVDPGFLFDFYSVRGSTVAPSGHSNGSWCGLGIFSGINGLVQFWSFFSNFDHPWNKHWKSGSSDFWNRRRMSDVVFKFIENSLYVEALRR